MYVATELILSIYTFSGNISFLIISATSGGLSATTGDDIVLAAVMSFMWLLLAPVFRC